MLFVHVFQHVFSWIKGVVMRLTSFDGGWTDDVAAGTKSRLGPSLLNYKFELIQIETNTTYIR